MGGTVQVCLQHFVPHLRRHLQERAIAGDAGIVDQDTPRRAATFCWMSIALPPQKDGLFSARDDVATAGEYNGIFCKRTITLVQLQKVRPASRCRQTPSVCEIQAASADEESARSFSEMIQGLGSPQQLQQHAGAAMQTTIAAVNHNLDETVQLMEENTKTGLELLDKAFGVLQSMRADDRQQKSREMWETAMGSLRRNTEVIVQANNRLFESWKRVAQIIRQADEPKQD